MGKIQELPASSARLLTSSQIISSVFCVVKELLENALDSGAKNVEVKLEEFGLHKVEVKDNGCGIDKSDIQFVAKPHFTSKITTYSDLNKVQTYGFRGEALGAVCAVADLQILTRSSEETIGGMTNFGHDGQILSTKPCPCPQGTTVSVLNLFKNIPVRRQYYRSEKNKKEELHKVEELLIAYGIIQHDVRFALYHNKNLIWQKTALSCVKHALIQSVGNSVFDSMKYVEYLNEDTQLKIELYLPKPDAPLSCGFSSASKCIIAVNKRPVKIKAIEKLLKEYYNDSVKNSGRARYPICYASFTVSPMDVDVNIEPNKTAVILSHSEDILAKFNDILKDFYNQDKTNDNNSNVNPPVPQDSSSNLKTTSSVDDFLESLKVSCDAKLQQSKLAFPRDTENSACGITPLGTPISKKDICIIRDKSEPCKKKMRTSLKASKDFENHVSFLKDYYATQEKGNESETLSLNSINTVADKKITSSVSAAETFEINQTSTMLNDINVNRIPTFNINKDFAGNKIGELSIPNQVDNHLDVSPVSSTVNNAEQIRTTAPSPQNVFCADKAVHSALNQEKCVPHIHAPSTTLKSDSAQKASANNVQDKGLWSRGTLPSGEHVQPVAVLQPKTAARSPKEANSAENLNKKSSPKQTSLSFERKLTAFDIFCRNSRLEVAAQNPNFNNHQIAQVLSEKWSHLSTEEKAVYKNMLDKDYPKEIKKKERLGKTISQNLSQDKTNTIVLKRSKKKFKPKVKSKTISCSMENMRSSYSLNRFSYSTEGLHIINHLAPGIWVCTKANKLYLLNTFRLQETIIYNRLLATYQFETEPLECPVNIPHSHLGDEAMATLLQLSKLKSDCKGNICDENITANGFEIRLVIGEEGQVAVEMLGIAKCSNFYGISDLKEILLLTKRTGFSAKLSECRPEKVLLYLQSEANRMSRQSPACLRLQDVEDLLCEKQRLLPNCDICMHHKPFLHEIWHISRSETSNT